MQDEPQAELFKLTKKERIAIEVLLSLKHERVQRVSCNGRKAAGKEDGKRKVPEGQGVIVEKRRRSGRKRKNSAKHNDYKYY